MQSLSHIGNLVCGESCGKPQVLFSHVPLFQCIPKRLIAYVHLSSCLSPSAGVRASHYSSFLANSQYFLTARRFRLDCAFPFRFYLHLISHNLFHALRLKICTILHEERKRVKKYTHNVDRGETLWVLSKMRNWLFNFHAGLFPYSCPIQTIQNHSGSGITDYHRVPYTFYAHVKHC